MRAGRCVPLRPKATITAAPFSEGTYDPSSCSPSLVCSSTCSTVALPRSMSSTAQQAAIAAARSPERHEPEAEQREPGRNGKETGEVVSRRADLRRVVHRLDAHHDSEEADHQRDRRTRAVAPA